MAREFIFWTIVMVLVRINADSTEEQPYTFNFDAPSSLRFHDFADTVHTNEYTEKLTEATTEVFADFEVIKKTQFVEFYPELTTEQSTVKPRKKYHSTFRAFKKPITSTTEDSESVVIPVRKEYEKGVLDLLLPSARVKSFKNAFDFFKRLMSHTFR